MSKNLLEIFNRYQPDNASAEALLSADTNGISLRADKEQRIIEVTAPFSRIIPRVELYRIEEEIRKKGDLAGSMASQGTTPRRLTDLIGSLCDLTSGSGDKGTPVILVQGYFDNYTN